jgi:uncharacterized protein
MSADEPARDTWLLAVWPGMGGVAISAGYYLMAKLGMHLLVEYPAVEYFDLVQVEVKDGLILTRRLPRSRLFLWKDPKHQHDIILFIGEAQPPARGGEFCRKLIRHAEELKVSKVFTFAAMSTQMRPEHPSRVFGAAIDRETLGNFNKLGIQMMEGGNISGLNGVLLGVAAASGISGGCFLGEIPHVFSQIPFPKASVAVLEFFTRMAGIELDLNELRVHAKKVDVTLADFLVRMEKSIEDGPTAEVTQPPKIEDPSSPPRTGSAARQRLEGLFEEAKKDRSLAYGLKQELDRLGLFNEYEDRFLDLFKEP